MQQSTPLIIELRCNESEMRSSNPTIPYTPDEIVAQAVRAREAGASILSWHARHPQTGVHDHSLVDQYLETSEKVHRETDLLLQPTLGNIMTETLDVRLAHVIAGARSTATWMDMVPVDFGAVNIDRWDAASKRFVPGNAVYANSRNAVLETLQRLGEIGTYVVAAVWDVAHVRTALKFQEMGLLSRDTLWVFPFTGDVRPAGSNVEIHALLAMVYAVPAGAHWQVMCSQGDGMTLAAWAVTLDGHVAIGLGDYNYPRLRNVTNIELVERVAHMAESVGRPVATPAQAREMLRVARPA